LQSGVYTLALQATKAAVEYDPTNFEAYYLMAQAYANLGQYQQAQDCCQQAIAADILSLKPYYLLAKVAEEQNDLERAKSILKKIIYLDPQAIAAYLELGAIYARENDAVRAMKMRSSAFEMLKQLPRNMLIEHQHQLSVGELLVYLKKILAERP
jgi:chemotaxis protein methyltransferase CheR